jgi:hypothetical protein
MPTEIHFQKLGSSDDLLLTKLLFSKEFLTTSSGTQTRTQEGKYISEQLAENKYLQKTDTFRNASLQLLNL